MPTHLPIRLLRPLHRQCLLRRLNIQPFSTTLTRARGSTASKRRRLADPVQTAAAARYQGGRASSAVYEEQLNDERSLPDDIGLLPGTFIRKPVLPNRLPGRIQLSPSRQAPPQFNNEPWHMQVRARLLYDWKFLVSQLKSWMMLARFKYVVSKCPPLHLIGNRAMIKNLARERYVHLYRSFAQGDSKAIAEMCLTGVAKAFRDRIAARPHGLTGEWKLNENGKVKTSIVSNRALLLSLSGYEDTGVQQIVLRMRSNQTLGYTSTSREPRDKTRKYSAKEGQVVEYLVLQRQMIRGIFKDWKVWGFANEWDLDTIGEDAQYEREFSEYQGSQVS